LCREWLEIEPTAALVCEFGIMPLDGNMGYQSHTFEEEFVRRAKWTLKFAWCPKKCMISGRWMWLELAYQGLVQRLDFHPYVMWADRHEYLIQRLKQ